jgi:hypothetical protein
MVAVLQGVGQVLVVNVVCGGPGVWGHVEYGELRVVPYNWTAISGADLPQVDPQECSCPLEWCDGRYMDSHAHWLKSP